MSGEPAVTHQQRAPQQEQTSNGSNNNDEQAISQRPVQLQPLLPTPGPPPAPPAEKLPVVPHTAPPPPPFYSLPFALHGATTGHSSLTMADQTPPVFKNRQPRSGKWIKEEEEYAEALRELFQRGQATDCVNGMTLRAYLSKKLHCAPMRISKKYAGKGIGKMVFVSKLGDPSMTAEQVRTLEQVVTDKEKRFYEAIFPSADSLSAPLANFVFTGLNVDGTSASATVPLVPAMVPNVGASFPFPHFAAGYPPAMLQVPTVAPNTTAPGNGSSSTQVQLQQSYLKAVQQQQLSSQNATHGSNTYPPAPLAARGSATAPLPAVAGNDSAPKELAWRPAEPFHPGLLFGPQMALNQSGPVSSEVATKPASRSDPQPNDDPLNGLPTEMPDFLAGFDKVALSLKPDGGHGQRASLRTEEASQFSPTFTSRSFDDLHSFWGTDLSALDSPYAKAHNTAPTSPKHSSGGPPMPALADHMALFNADSYAMFAVESAAVVASQHSAYLPPLNNNMTVRESFDVEQTVKLVSQRVGSRAASTTMESGDESDDNNRMDSSSDKESSDDSYKRKQPSLSTVPNTMQQRIDYMRLFGSRNAALVSGSEPSSSATETESGMGSYQSSGTSDNVSSHDSEENNSSSEGSGSDSELSKRKRRRKDSLSRGNTQLSTESKE